jgi:hypothetical protein
VNGHDELACITDAAAMYTTLLDDAVADDDDGFTDDEIAAVEGELREALPVLLVQLSPAARCVLHDHAGHLREVVAHVHRLEARYPAVAI